MRLDYAKGGLQFFFVTLASAERKAVFSRLVSEGSRPELSAIGELARAGLRAVHRVWPAVTVSDYVIMPDHLHFLLIVNYDCDKSISPLFVAHRVADAVEMAVARGVERTGARAPAPPARPLGATTRAPAPPARPSSATARAPAPSATPPLATSAPAKLAEDRVAEMAGFLKASVEAANVVAAAGGLAVEKGLRFGAIVGGAGASAPVRSVVFARDCYIELSFDARQLKAIRHYIKLNPARALWKLRHPDLFLCHRAIKARRFAPLAPQSFDGIGALSLLGSPFLFHVRLTLKKTVAEHAAAIEEIVEKARHGMVPVSGFISPGEKEALRRLKAEPRARFVKLLSYTLPTRYDPSAEDCREIAAGRLLVLSCFRDMPGIPSLDMKRNRAAAHRFRQNCLAMNDIAARLCASDGFAPPSKKEGIYGKREGNGQSAAREKRAVDYACWHQGKALQPFYADDRPRESREVS